MLYTCRTTYSIVMKAFFSDKLFGLEFPIEGGEELCFSLAGDLLQVAAYPFAVEIMGVGNLAGEGDLLPQLPPKNSGHPQPFTIQGGHIEGIQQLFLVGVETGGVVIGVEEGDIEITTEGLLLTGLPTDTLGNQETFTTFLFITIIDAVEGAAQTKRCRGLIHELEPQTMLLIPD